MIYLLTGSNGAGKTLYSIQMIVEQLNEKGDRPVYYYSPETQPLNPIPELNWHPLTIDEVRDWMNLPQGSIIFIDEFRHVFPSRRPQEKPPEFVDRLAEHRSLGLDFVLTAQKPTGQFDSALQGFIEEHRHLVRVKGTKAVRHMVYNSFCSDPLRPPRLLQPDVQIKKQNTKYFNYYKSASLHTVNDRFPYRIFAYIALAAVFALGFGIFAYKSFKGMAEQPAEKQGVSIKNIERNETKSSSFLTPSVNKNEVLTTEEYLELRIPRIPDIPSSAPIYDHLTEPVSYPRVSACYQHHKSGDCRCYSQQGTILQISKPACIQYVRYGAFDNAVPDTRSFQTRDQLGNAQTLSRESRQAVAMPAQAFTY